MKPLGNKCSLFTGINYSSGVRNKPGDTTAISATTWGTPARRASQYKEARAEMESRGLGDKVIRPPRTQLCPESVVHLKDRQCEGDPSCRCCHPSGLFLLSTSLRDSERVETTCPASLQVSQLREPFRCSVPESEIKINCGVRLMAEIRLKHKSQTLPFQTHDQPRDGRRDGMCRLLP